MIKWYFEFMLCPRRFRTVERKSWIPWFLRSAFANRLCFVNLNRWRFAVWIGTCRKSRNSGQFGAMRTFRCWLRRRWRCGSLNAFGFWTSEVFFAPILFVRRRILLGGWADFEFVLCSTSNIAIKNFAAWCSVGGCWRLFEECPDFSNGLRNGSLAPGQSTPLVFQCFDIF